ncbi:hypothetical protein [Flexivirga oryzae]|uniref:GAF domain-containing protein n=1 Tax=Flexivirga oryzae TaxID=1794944 RepID=A0A839NHC1_9MICO|nr:hypothetical protein [Flexivirga oryzae]MBB2893822.1 hypothetical protein [Flexivirga oryzae]
MGIALGGSVLVPAQIVSVRADTLATRAHDHESDNFHAFAASPTGEARTIVDSLLTRYLAVKVPDRGKTFFTMINGKPHRRIPGTPAGRLDTDRAFVAHIADARKPMSRWWSSSARWVRYGVIPVTVDGDRAHGALVITELRDEQAKPPFSTVRIFAIVGAAALTIAALDE